MSTRIARTTFMPWREIEMFEGEYQDLLRQGLIYLDAPEPAVEVEPADVPDEPKHEPKPSPAPRHKR